MGATAHAERDGKRIVARLQDRGFSVVAVHPYDTRREDGRGLFDLLKDGGVSAVRARLAKFLDASRPIDLAFSPLDQSRASFRDELESAMLEMVVWERSGGSASSRR